MNCIPDSIKGKKNYSKKIKIKRFLWGFVWNVLIRWIPHYVGIKWTRFWYNLFGAKIPSSSAVHNSAKVFMPWNLVMGEYSVIGSGCNVYNAAPIIIGNACVVSERAFLCTASHNIHSRFHEQIEKAIILEDKSWVAAEAMVCLGVTIGEGAVVGARGCVFKDVTPWTVVGGNPAKFIKKRELK